MTRRRPIDLESSRQSSHPLMQRIKGLRHKTIFKARAFPLKDDQADRFEDAEVSGKHRPTVIEMFREFTGGERLSQEEFNNFASGVVSQGTEFVLGADGSAHDEMNFSSNATDVKWA